MATARASSYINAGPVTFKFFERPRLPNGPTCGDFRVRGKRERHACGVNSAKAINTMSFFLGWSFDQASQPAGQLTGAATCRISLARERERESALAFPQFKQIVSPALTVGPPACRPGKISSPRAIIVTLMQ